MAAVGACVAVLATSCGSDGDGAPGAASPPSRTAGSVPEGGGAQGVGGVEWPGDVQAARQLFGRMPGELGGHPRKVMGGEASNTPGVFYGSFTSGMVAYVMGPSSGVKEPTAALAAMFGMGYTCDRGTYAGTAPQSRYGGPDMARGSRVETDNKLWWFSCDFSGERPSDTGHAVGWVSGELAWLATAPDRETSRSLIDALRASA